MSGIETGISGSVSQNSDHRGGLYRSNGDVPEFRLANCEAAIPEFRIANCEAAIPEFRLANCEDIIPEFRIANCET
uniref:(California timema) hypothetical protein n=1 Tax=Timema californicum TaxID=61474 RepID=A0A7R9J9E7_TIMCA|nr:unnamed protein product [Timema californicum]